MAYNNISVGATATLIVAANSKRQSLIITNDGTVTLYVGPDSSVTATNGIQIEEDGNFTEDSGGSRVYQGDWYGIVSAGTGDCRFWERLGQ